MIRFDALYVNTKEPQHIQPKGNVRGLCEKNGFTGIRHFTDDGISGMTFEIAVNEGIDTGSGFDDDFLPFRDVINEYYAKDISKKIKSTFKAKGESGKHVVGSPPYGYLKDSEDKNKWVIDEVAVPVEICQGLFHHYGVLPLLFNELMYEILQA